MTGAPKTRHRVGIDNYGLLPLRLSPHQVLSWASRHGAEGVAFSGLPADERDAMDEAALRDLSQLAVSLGLYLEWGGAQHIPRDMTSWARKELAGINRRAAAEAAALGVRVVRSCSGGLMRWSAHAPATDVLLAETASALRAQRHLIEDHGIVLAIETHFEFTSFELVRLLERCEAEPGGWLGICLDTMNLLTMLEDPVCATKRLLPWVVSTHIKDGGLLLSPEGFTAFPAPVGAGTIALAEILALLDGLDTRVNLSVEDHGGAFDIPLFEPVFLARFPDLSAGELALLVAASQRTAAKDECRPLDRARWPEVAESRMISNVQALRALAGHV